MNRIKELRLEYNLSQKALAEKIGMSQQAIDLWEKSLTELKAGAAIALADVFECSTDYLFGREYDFGNVNVMRDLSNSEIRLLTVFSRLNKSQQAELFRFTDYLTFKQ